mgnify:CR=1 FL=1
MENKYNLKVGDIIIAKDECIMDDTKLPALIIGKEYEITFIGKNTFIINSEIGEHTFGFVDFNDFVTVDYPVGCGFVDVIPDYDEEEELLPWTN